MVTRAVLAGDISAIGTLLVDGVIPPEADVASRTDFLVWPLPRLLLFLFLLNEELCHLVEFSLNGVRALLLELLAVFLV